MSFLERLQGFRQGRGKDTPFLDEWMAAGGVGSGFLKDKYSELGENIDAGNRPFLGGLRNNSNALLLGGAGMAQGRGGFGPGFAQGAQIDQANADQRRQLAEQDAYQQAVSGLQIPAEVAPLAPYLNPGDIVPLLLPQGGEPQDLIATDNPIYDPSTGQWIEPPAGLEPEEDFGDLASLRNQFDRLTGQHRDVDAAYRRVLASGSDPSGAGDLSLIFNYMKMLDPESVVRESEFKTAAETGGLGEQIQGFALKIASGQRLAPEVREDFMNRAGMLYEAARQQYDLIAGQYTTLAQQLGLDPSQVVLPWPAIDIAPGAQMPTVFNPANPAAPVGPSIYGPLQQDFPPGTDPADPFGFGQFRAP